MLGDLSRGRIWSFFQWIAWNVGKFDCWKCFLVVDRSWVGSFSSNGGFSHLGFDFQRILWSMYWKSVIWLAFFCWEIDSEDGRSVFGIWVSAVRGSGLRFWKEKSNKLLLFISSWSREVSVFGYSCFLVFFHLAFYFWENLVCSKKEGKKEYPICWNSGFQEDILSGDGLFLVCVAFGLKVWTVWREGEVSWIETENGKDMFSLLGGGIARFSMGRYLPCNSLSFWHKLWRSVRFPCSYLLYDIFMSANYRICCYSIVTTGFCTLSSLIVFG